VIASVHRFGPWLAARALPLFFLPCLTLGDQTATAKGGTSFEALSKQAQQAEAEQRLDDAIPLLQRALKLKPDWDEGWWSLGSLTYDKDSYSDCAAAFKRLAALQPDSVPAWTMLGLCEYRLRDFDKALSSFETTEKLKFQEPHELSRTAQLHYALVLIKTGSFEKAISILTNLTRFDSKTGEVVVAAGIAGLRKPWLPAEVPDADRDKVTKLGDAMASGMEQDYKSAIPKFEAAIAAYPNEPNIHFRFGAYLQLHEPERGIEELKKTLELDPQHLLALLGLAAVYTIRGDVGQALPYAERAVKASPNEYGAHVVLGRALLAGDDATGAAKELERAVALEPDNPDARFSLASAYSRLGRKQDALREQNEFKRLKKTTDAGSP
jgi:tetratricopeptide (TPR) repeat protein